MEIVMCCWVCVFSHVRLFETPWTVACQAPLSVGFSRQEYWNRLPFSTPGDLPKPGIEPSTQSLVSPALAGRFFTTAASEKSGIVIVASKGEVPSLLLSDSAVYSWFGSTDEVSLRGE